jgi:hypothetical protein
MARVAIPRIDRLPAEGAERGMKRAILRHCIAVALATFAWVLLASLSGAPARADALQSLTIHTSTGDHVFSVEIAATPPSRETGLMNRRFMPMDRGMLFEFDREEPVAFWMKNTYIPLDMIFISRTGKVTRVANRAEPLSETVIPSGGPASAVLELNGGVAAAIGVRPGDQIIHPFFKP